MHLSIASDSKNVAANFADATLHCHWKERRPRYRFTSTEFYSWDCNVDKQAQSELLGQGFTSNFWSGFCLSLVIFILLHATLMGYGSSPATAAGFMHMTLRDLARRKRCRHHFSLIRAWPQASTLSNWFSVHIN